MLYPVLAIIFFVSILLAVALFFTFIFKPHSKFKIFGFVWFFAYGVFILFFTGPVGEYPAPKYYLPWAGGVSRFVAQGNRSFTSHRGFHLYAWDFVMPNGTEVLAARAGKVIQVEDSFDGIGFDSNVIAIEHEDGEQSHYAHIRHASALVKVGEVVRLGQPIALSGMVGQTPGPHLHFTVVNRERTSSIPVSFYEGLPLAGHFYTSENTRTP